MSFINTGLSAIWKLFAVVTLLAAFLGGMAGVVYMSLSGNEIKVPEITGKDFNESEKELAGLGLRIKRRADRLSSEKINTVLEQLPKAGETVKTGQMILVVVSKAGIEGDETPKSLIKDIESDDSETIKDMISEKPKKPKANSNTNAKKKADTTRDVLGNNSNTNSTDDASDGTNSKSDDSNKKDTTPGTTTGDKNKNSSTGPAVKPQNLPGPVRMTSTKPGSVQTRQPPNSKP